MSYDYLSTGIHMCCVGYSDGRQPLLTHTHLTITFILLTSYSFFSKRDYICYFESFELHAYICK